MRGSMYTAGLRSLKSTVVLALALTLPLSAVAQDDEPAAPAQSGNVERVEGYNASEALAFRQVQERFALRMKELEDDTRAFVDRKEAIERDKLSASYDGVISTLETAETDQREQAIARMEAYLKKYADSDYHDHVRFRLAEMEFELAREKWLSDGVEYERLAAELGFDRLDELPPEPKVDFGRSISLYERIIADNKDRPADQRYQFMDGVYYMLGWCHNEPNAAQFDEDAALVAFNKLVENHPESALSDPGHLFIGNYHFDRNELEPAVAHYKAVFDKGAEGEYYIASLYQLAWAYYKQAAQPAEYDRALDMFAQVLTDSEVSLRESGRESEYAPDAVKYMAISMSDIADKTDTDPVEVAKGYFSRATPTDYERDVYVQLGEVLTQQARWDEAISVFRFLQDDPRWVDHPENPDWQMRIVKLWLQPVPPDLAASAAARIELTERYSDGSEWWLANRNNPRALATARSYIEASLQDVAIEYRLNADQTGNPDDYALAAAKFREYMDKFPISDDYYQVQWYLADTLYRGGFHEEALSENADLIRTQRAHDYGDAATYFSMDAALALLQQNNAPPALPEEQLDPAQREMALNLKAPLWVVPQKNKVEKTYEAPSGNIAVHSLSDDHVRFIDSADAVLSHDFTAEPIEGLPDFNEIIGERHHKIQYLIAQVLFFHNRYEEARPRLMSLVRDYNETLEGSYAAGLMVTAAQNEGDLAEVRRLTSEFVRIPLGPDEELQKARQSEFRNILEGTAFKQALAFTDAKEYAEAADAFYAFTNEFPESEYVPLALYNAANNSEKAGDAARANELFEDYVNRYPDDERSKQLYFRIAANYEATFELEKAIDYYGRLISRFPDYQDTPNAVYNQSFLKIGLGDHKGAAQGYMAYAKDYPDQDDREEVYFQAGKQWEEVGDRDARRFYEGYLAEYGFSNPDHALYSKYWLSEMHLRAGRVTKAKQLKDEIVADYARLVSEGVPVGMGRRYAAERAFALLSEEFEVLTKDKLIRDEAKDAELIFQIKPAEVVEFEKKALDLVSRYQDFEYSAAALYLAGSGYLYLADLGYSIECPRGYSEAECDLFMEVIYAEGYPQFDAAQAKAIARFERIIKTATDQKQYSEWVGKAYDALNELEPKDYPALKLEIRGEPWAADVPPILPVRAEPPAPEKK
ncbi:MAG: tetratricopeptide repeat protein [Deltaproteobacteria bacterium]|nr:MAG: tetratricopeptide repeat protein [Deltaproteobacteria bacterium]